MHFVLWQYWQTGWVHFVSRNKMRGTIRSRKRLFLIAILSTTTVPRWHKAVVVLPQIRAKMDGNCSSSCCFDAFIIFFLMWKHLAVQRCVLWRDESASYFIVLFHFCSIFSLEEKLSPIVLTSLLVFLVFSVFPSLARGDVCTAESHGANNT